jgi:hypothetical protein
MKTKLLIMLIASFFGFTCILLIIAAMPAGVWGVNHYVSAGIIWLAAASLGFSLMPSREEFFSQTSVLVKLGPTLTIHSLLIILAGISLVLALNDYEYFSRLINIVTVGSIVLIYLLFRPLSYTIQTVLHSKSQVDPKSDWIRQLSLHSQITTVMEESKQIRELIELLEFSPSDSPKITKTLNDEISQILSAMKDDSNRRENILLLSKKIMERRMLLIHSRERP